MTFGKKKYKRAPRVQQYRCTACGQSVTQNVGWSSCPHCNEMGKLVKVEA